MTAALATLAARAEHSDELADLRAAVDPRLLARHGWDDAKRRFAPSAEDPVFGYELCIVVGCVDAALKRGLCTACDRRLDKMGGERAAFVAMARPQAPFDEDGPGLCLVCRTPGHERPAVGPNGLCRTCEGRRRWRRQSVQALVDGDDRFAPAEPLASFGRCARSGCGRWAAFEESSLCNRCHEDWRTSGRPDVRKWRATSGLMTFGGGRFVDFAPLTPRVRVELLLGIQEHAERETRLSCHTVQEVAGRLLRGGFGSITELADKPGTSRDRVFIRHTQRRVALALSDPEAELTADVWRLAVLGLSDPRAHLRFTAIKQPWLRAAAKEWAAESIARSVSRTADVVAAVGELSASLATRAEKHEGPAMLGRSDVVRFLGRLGRAESAGRVSVKHRRTLVYNVRYFLRGCREMGLTQPGGTLAGLPDTFAILPADLPKSWRDDDTPTDRSLPAGVVAQLLAPDARALLVGQSGDEVADMIELHIWIGRRPTESVALEFGCLEADGAGDPVLRFDARKQRIRRARIPIQQEAAAIIKRQQARVRAAFPATPESELALWPRPNRNPHGTHRRIATSLGMSMRRWVDALPSLTGPDGQEFPRDRVFPYAFRHTYAQRHADAGTPVDVLSALLVHDSLHSTQAYYHVPEKRKKMATALVAPLMMDRAGHLVGGSDALDAMLTRREIGQIPVPLGWCTESNNVKAHGHGCVYRYRCLGCGHFRTDPSHLDDLRGHLQRLLAAREELAAAMPALADWARDDALPSDEEIAATRQLIRAAEHQLSTLDEADRNAILEAVRELRKLRSQMRASMPDTTHLRVQLVAPKFTPGLERHG